MKHEDVEQRNKRLIETFEEIAASNREMARYLFWTRIWAFVAVLLMWMLALQLDDVIKAVRVLHPPAQEGPIGGTTSSGIRWELVE